MSSLNDVQLQALDSVIPTDGAMNDKEKKFWETMTEGGIVTQDYLENHVEADGTHYVRCKVANITMPSDGSTTAYAFPHGCATVPTYVGVNVSSAIGVEDRSVSWGANNILVTYTSPPAPGTINFFWVALV